METYQALLLGILQGLTEFLPVSSSGHLALAQHSFEITEPTLFFDISLHIGTLFAVGVVFFEDIKSMIITIINMFLMLIKFNMNIDSFQKYIKENPDLRLALLIIVGSIPTALIGLFLKQYADILFGSINFVGTMLLITGTFLWLTKDIKTDEKKRTTASDNKHAAIINFGYKQALLIGICQGIAVIPGISRSGSTIAAGLFAGIDRETAARFSFLLSIPAIVGAELLGFKDVLNGDGGAASINMATIYGILIAFVVGYAALKILVRIVKNGKLHLFAPYCWVLGVIAVILGVL